MAIRNFELNLTWKSRNIQPFLSVTLCRLFKENIGSCIFSLIFNIVICLSYSLALVLLAEGCFPIYNHSELNIFSDTYFPRYFWRFLINIGRVQSHFFAFYVLFLDTLVIDSCI